MEVVASCWVQIFCLPMVMLFSEHQCFLCFRLLFFRFVYLQRHVVFIAGDLHDKTPQLSNHATPQLSEPSQSDTMNETVLESEGRNAADAVAEDQKNVDPLDKFLPPPLKAKCSEELQVSSQLEGLLFAEQISKTRQDN